MRKKQIWVEVFILNFKTASVGLKIPIKPTVINELMVWFFSEKKIPVDVCVPPPQNKGSPNIRLPPKIGHLMNFLGGVLLCVEKRRKPCGWEMNEKKLALLSWHLCLQTCAHFTPWLWFKRMMCLWVEGEDFIHLKIHSIFKQIYSKRLFCLIKN